jgi:hypothetical protein
MAYCSKGKVCIGLKKTNHHKIDVDIPVRENFDFSEALDSVYPLTEMIFSYLDYKSLQTVGQVKKSWQITANNILEKRNKVSWITVFRKKRLCYVHDSDNYHNHNTAASIILFNCSVISLSDSLCCHENLTQKKIKFLDFISNQVVPHGTDYCIMGCSGVESLLSKKIVYKSSVRLFDGCFIPPIPNVRISMFNVNPQNMNDKYIRPNSEKLKCLLLFSKIDLEDGIFAILDQLIPEGGCRSVALGGGIVRKTVQTNVSQKEGKCLCIAFTQNICTESDFNASSVVIQGDDLSPREFEAHLLKFKNKIVVRSNSLAFRICCSAKTQKNQESRIFNEIFPDTPLLGLEAEGEFGWNSHPQKNKEINCHKQNLLEPEDEVRRVYHNNCSNDSDDELQNRRTKKRIGSYPRVQHQWTTVIVFITWGQLVDCK